MSSELRGGETRIIWEWLLPVALLLLDTTSRPLSSSLPHCLFSTPLRTARLHLSFPYAYYWSLLEPVCVLGTSIISLPPRGADNSGITNPHWKLQNRAFTQLQSGRTRTWTQVWLILSSRSCHTPGCFGSETGLSSHFTLTILVFRAKLCDWWISLHSFPLNWPFLSFPFSPWPKPPWQSLAPSGLLWPFYFLRSLIPTKVTMSDNSIKCHLHFTPNPLRVSAFLLACGPTGVESNFLPSVFLPCPCSFQGHSWAPPMWPGQRSLLHFYSFHHNSVQPEPLFHSSFSLTQHVFLKT